MKKNTLVTGAFGLIGSEFQGEEFYRLSSKECDLRDKIAVEQLFKTNNFEEVIHCASRVAGIQGNINKGGEFYYDNILMNTHLIETSRKFGITNFVGFLSTCIFPDNISFPYTESKIHLGPPHFSNAPYAYSKRSLDIQIQAYRRQYSLNYHSVVPCNCYGRNDWYNIEEGHLVPSVIHKVYLARENNTPLIVWGNGIAQREFVYAEDIAYLTKWVLDNYHETEPIILSPSVEVSISELVRLITSIMGFKGDIVWDDSKPTGQIRKPSSNAKIKKYLPNYKFTPLEDGLKQTISFFEENYNTIRK